MISRIYSINQIYSVDQIYLVDQLFGQPNIRLKRFQPCNICETYREACLVRGLLENDQHLSLAMQEVTVNQSPTNLRSLLAIILTSCIPSNPGDVDPLQEPVV